MDDTTFDPESFWAENLAGVSNEDLQAYIDDYGLTPDVPTDPALMASLTTAKAQAASKGNTNFEGVLNKVLIYSDKILTILTKNGIIKNQNLVNAGYTIDTSKLTAADATSNAPSTTNKVFGLDLTDTKTLIIIALVIGIIIYLIATSGKRSTRRK